MSKIFALVRTIVLGTVFHLAFIALALGAIIINYTIFTFNGFSFTFAVLNVATASLTILTLPVMLLVSRYRKGAFTSMVAVEVGWTFVLWVMWLSSGALIPSVFPEDVCVFALASRFPGSPLCPLDQALTATAFLTWALLFKYNMTLIWFVIRHQLRGHANVWTGYVLEIDFSAPGPSAHPSEPKDNHNYVYTMGNVPHQYPPVNQHGGYVARPAVPMTPQMTWPTTMTPVPQV